MSTLLEKYEVVHRVATAYHPHTNGQVEGNQETLAKDGGSRPKRLEPTPKGRSIGPQDSIPDSVGNVSLPDRLW
ncbi:hypothetical protein CR513_32752, partial [Mucuna pruriens]